MNLRPEELRREIDDTLATLDELEADVIALIEQLGGPDLAQRLLAYYEAQAKAPRTAALRPEGSLAPSKAPRDSQ